MDQELPPPQTVREEHWLTWRWGMASHNNRVGKALWPFWARTYRVTVKAQLTASAIYGSAHWLIYSHHTLAALREQPQRPTPWKSEGAPCSESQCLNELFPTGSFWVNVRGSAAWMWSAWTKMAEGNGSLCHGTEDNQEKMLQLQNRIWLSKENGLVLDLSSVWNTREFFQNKSD